MLLASAPVLTELDGKDVTLRSLTVNGGVLHASLPGLTPGIAAARDPIAALLARNRAAVDFTGYYLQGLPPSRPLLADWRPWPWPRGLNPFLLMAHSSPQNQLCLMVDGEARPVADQALGSWLRALPDLNTSKRPLEDPVVVLTCSTGAMRAQIADMVGRLVWFPHGEMTVGAKPLDAVGRAAGDRVRLGLRRTEDGEGGRFRSSYPQGPAGDRVRFAYRSRFAFRPADWLVERSAAPGTRAPAGMRPYPIGGERALGLSYFDRRDRASRLSALAAPMLGPSYVAWTPNDAYQPGTSAHAGPVVGVPRAAARPWHTRELGELPFDLDGVATVACYFADGLFAVYDERQDLTYWEMPLAFGRRLRKDLAAAQAAGPPPRVLLLTDFDAISENAREQVVQGLGGPELITVNVPSTLFLDEDSQHGAPRSRIALLPAISGLAAPVWTATTTAGTSTTLSPGPRDLGDRTHRALSEEDSVSAQDDVSSLVEPGASFDEAAWREQSAAVLEWVLKGVKERRAAPAGGADQVRPPTVPPTQSSIVQVPRSGRPDMSHLVGGMAPASHVSDLSGSPSLLPYGTSAAETRPYAAPPVTSRQASGQHSAEAPQYRQPPLARTEGALAVPGSAGMPATPSTSGSRQEPTELRSGAQNADFAASPPASATHGTESADDGRPSTGPLTPAEDQLTGQVGNPGAEASVAAEPDMLPAVEEFVRTHIHVPDTVEQPASARAELTRLLNHMLRNPDVATRVLGSGVRVVVVPRNTRVTDLGRFAHLRDVHEHMDSGGTRISRELPALTNPDRHVIAIPEENLLGETTLVPPRGYFPDGYSAAVHELAHMIHVYGLTEPQQALLVTLHREKLALGPHVLWPDGPRTDLQGRTTENYSSRGPVEYFAQATSAYLHTNHGTDPYTGRTRNNGPRSIRVNESTQLYHLLGTLYGARPEPLATNPVRATRRLNDSYEALRDFDHLITTRSAEPPGDSQGGDGESVVPVAIPTNTVTPPMYDLPTIVVTPPAEDLSTIVASPPTGTVPERERHLQTISAPDHAPGPASERGPELGPEPAPELEDGAPARPLSDPVLRFGTRRDGALELAHITPVPQATVEWLRERVIELVENGQGPDPEFHAGVRRVLTARLLSAEWARLFSVAGLPLNVTYRKRRHPVSLRLGLTALGPSPQQLGHMSDGPPVSVQRWAFGINEAGDSGGSGDLRAFGHAFSHTWSVDKGPLRRITFTPQPSLTYNQLTTSVAVGTTVQPMVLIRSKGRHWPFDYAMTWELRRNDGPITSPLGTLPALGWEPAPGLAPGKLLVWFPTYLSTSEGLPDVDPARPESVPAPLYRLLDEVPLFGPQALADHDVLFADVLRSFADPLASLSEGSRRELFEFFGEGNLRSNFPQTWGGSVASPTLYTSSGEAIGYLRIGAELTGGDTITGPTTASSVLETYILRSLRVQGSAQIGNGAGFNVSITLGFGTGAPNSPTGVEPLGGQFTFQFGGQHQFTHVLTSGGSARIAHSLRTATPLLQVTPRMRLRITLVRPDSAPLGPTAGSPLDGGKHYPVVMLVPSLDALGHVPTQTRYLPPEVLHLKQLGVSTTPLQVSGTSPLFDQAERWLRDNGFLPSDRPETRRWDKAMDQAIRTQRLNNLRKLDQMRSRLGLRSALDEMIEGGDTTWFELPTPLGTQRVSVRLVTERRYAAPDAHAGVEHQRTLPKIQTLNYTGSTIAGEQQFQSTPFAWNVGGEGAVSNPLDVDGDQRLEQIRPHYSYTSQTTRNTGSSTGTGHEYYMLSPTQNGTQVFALPVTHRMVITHSHGPNPEPVSADGSVRLAVPTFRTLDRPSPSPRPGPATVRDHSHRDDRLLALPNPGRTLEEGVLRLPETALLDRVGGSAALRREVLAMIKDIEQAVAEENERYVMPPTPGAWIEEDDVEAQDTATDATVEPRAVPRPWSSPLLRAAGGLIAGSAHWVSGSVGDAGRWVWRASVGEPATAHESSANEVADTALSPHHLSANALRIFRDSYPVEGAATPGVLAGTDFTIEVRGYLTDVRVLPQPPKLDAERWLQSTDASASTRNRQAGHQGGLSMAGRYGGKGDAVAPQGGLQARVARADSVTVNDNTGVFRVTTEDTTAAYRFTAKAHYVVTVRSGARNLASGTVAPGLGGLNRTRVVELPDGVEFLLVDNDLQNHPDLAALVAEVGQTSTSVGPPDRRLPAWYVDSGGTIGAGVVTEVHTGGGRDSFQRRIHRLVLQEAPGVTTPGHAAYVPGVLTRINELSTSLGLRTLVNAGPQGHTAFHFVHRSWLGPRLVEVALVARPAPGQDLSAHRGKRVTTTSGMDNVFGHSHGDGTALEVPGATRISSTRTISGQVNFAPLGESNGERARSTLSLARQSNRSDAQSSSRELRSWQRTFGNTCEFPVPYEYEVRVSSRPLTESLVGRLADLLGSMLDLAAVSVLPLPSVGLFPASRIGRREVEPATAVLRFNASETPDQGERRATTIPPAVFTTDPTVPRPTPPPGGVAVEVEVPADLRVLLSSPAWVPARPIEIYDFGGMDELRDALRAVDHSLKDTSRPRTTTSTEGMLIRLTSLAQSNRLTPLEPAAIAPFLGHPGGTGVSMKITLYSPRAEVTSKDTAIDRIELSADGFQTQADNTITPSLSYNHSSRYASTDRGGPTVPVLGDRAMLGQNASSSSQRRELLRFGTPMANARGEGLDGHRVRAVALVEVHGPSGTRWVAGDLLFRTTETPPGAGRSDRTGRSEQTREAEQAP